MSLLIVDLIKCGEDAPYPLNEEYFNRATEEAKCFLEKNFNTWAKSDRRYVLSVSCSLTSTDWTQPSGPTIEQADLFIYSDNIEVLEKFWKTQLIQSTFSINTHFIADIKEKKVIKILCICA